MTASPLSAAWFERARELVAGLPEQPGVGCRIQFEAEEHRCHLVAVDGRIVEWAPGDLADPAHCDATDARSALA